MSHGLPLFSLQVHLRKLTQPEFLERFKQTDIVPGIVSDNAEIKSRELSSPENYLHLENTFNYP